MFDNCADTSFHLLAVVSASRKGAEIWSVSKDDLKRATPCLWLILSLFLSRWTYIETTHCWRKYHCTAGLLFYKNGFSSFSKYKYFQDIFFFGKIQSSQTGAQLCSLDITNLADMNLEKTSWMRTRWPQDYHYLRFKQPWVIDNFAVEKWHLFRLVQAVVGKTIFT